MNDIDNPLRIKRGGRLAGLPANCGEFGVYQHPSLGGYALRRLLVNHVIKQPEQYFPTLKECAFTMIGFPYLQKIVALDILKSIRGCHHEDSDPSARERLLRQLFGASVDLPPGLIVERLKESGIDTLEIDGVYLISMRGTGVLVDQLIRYRMPNSLALHEFTYI